ncbi:hypothetical protein [Streptomyces sp. NPDC002908]|uniref:hypothetical protein n=1 Tax=Streptomyces sp. NPDC002908 TaxID=3364670 RepID=UPI00368CCA3D
MSTPPPPPASAPQPEQPRRQVRRRAEQDPVLDNLVWLQRTRTDRLADQRRQP